MHRHQRRWHPCPRRPLAALRWRAPRRAPRAQANCEVIPPPRTPQAVRAIKKCVSVMSALVLARIRLTAARAAAAAARLSMIDWSLPMALLF
jgi:hypothetical protein